MDHPLIVGLALLIAGTILTGVIWTVRTVSDVRSILIGHDGKNGTRGEVTRLRDEQRAQGNSIHRVSRQIGLLKQQVEHLAKEIERLCDDQRNGTT